MSKLTNTDAPTWGLYATQPKKNMEARKSIKVKLPIRQHIRLHALKLFTEKNISETVEKALDAYFTTMKAEEAATLGKLEANLQNDPTIVLELTTEE